MYQLYWDATSGAFVIHALLEEISANYRRIPIDCDSAENRVPAFLAVNPMGQVPTLVLPDGSTMTESAAMVLHLVDAHPEAGLAPPPGTLARAQFDRWLLFMAVNLYEPERRFYYPSRFTTDPDGAEAVRAAGLRDLEAGLDLVESLLLDPGPLAMGAGYSALDPYLAMLAWWHPDLPELLSPRPRLAALCQAVRERPAVTQIWSENFPKLA